MLACYHTRATFGWARCPESNLCISAFQINSRLEADILNASCGQMTGRKGQRKNRFLLMVSGLAVHGWPNCYGVWSGGTLVERHGQESCSHQVIQEGVRAKTHPPRYATYDVSLQQGCNLGFASPPSDTIRF